MQRTITIISCVALAFALGACSKKQDKNGEDKPKTAKVQEDNKPKPKEDKVAKVEIKTGDDMAKRALECIKFGAERNVDKMKSCYTPDVTVTFVDFMPPMVTKGADKVAENAQAFWKGFPDESFEPHVLLVKDKQQAVVVGLTSGTNSGEFMGNPATNKKIGVLGANQFSMNEAGQISEENMFVDQGTWHAQLMGAEYPFRAAMEKTGKPAAVVVAKGDETEANNVKMIQEMGKAFNAHDQAKSMEHYADDAKFIYIAHPQDHVGKKAIDKGLADYFKMSSDVKSEAQWMWGAGDYVVGRFTITGTNDGDMPGGMKATKKPFKSDELNVYKLQDGKIKEHWIFSNATSMAVQLGMAPNPAEMKKHGDDAAKAPEKKSGK